MADAVEAEPHASKAAPVGAEAAGSASEAAAGPLGDSADDGLSREAPHAVMDGLQQALAEREAFRAAYQADEAAREVGTEA